jgi:ferredoxin-NADP reductase
MSSMTFAGRLLEKIARGGDAFSFRFSRPPEYRFEAGQSFSVTIPSPEGPLEHYFSHADSPTEDHTELTTRLTGSPFKRALDALPLGAEAIFQGPNGAFVFRHELPRIAFLAGGIGITPVRSMLRYLADTKGTGRAEGQELVLFYGSVTEERIIYREELDQIARAVPGLRVMHVISQPTDGWQGRRGLIDAEVLRSELADPTAWTYYIVGPPPMIAAMERVMAELRLPQPQIVTESFAGYAS